RGAFRIGGDATAREQLAQPGCGQCMQKPYAGRGSQVSNRVALLHIVPNGPARTIFEADVVNVSDLRLGGGTAGSLAEEMAIQHRCGYTTAVAHLNSRIVSHVAPVNPRVRQVIKKGQARLALPGRRVRARIAVFRHPAVVEDGADELPAVEADRVVLIANVAPVDSAGDRRYTPTAVSRTLHDTYGLEPIWAPVGPYVRDRLESELPSDAVFADDWSNVIDVDAWRVARTGWRSDRPVVGRCSSTAPHSWPSDPRVIRAVYPTDGSWAVRVLGSSDAIMESLGSVPDAWDVLPPQALSVQEFLASLDFFVCYYDRRWPEPFRRPILEAIASGALAVLPPNFEGLFGSAAVYAEPERVRTVVDGYFADRPAYERHVSEAEQLIRRRFGVDAHLARLRALVGEPSGKAAKARGVGSRTTGAGHEQVDDSEAVAHGRGAPAVLRRRHRILMVTSNGAGMGHLTRLLAMSRRCPDRYSPHFLSLSEAVPLVGEMGFPYEYVSSRPATELEPPRWHAYFRARLDEAISRLRPAAIVFDGTWPYESITKVREDHPTVPWVWCRRGMWKAGMNADQLSKAEWFDLVIEPGDLAASGDQGVTAEASATRVGPITLLDHDELLSRAEARLALGLPADSKVALVSLGAGNINDTSSVLRCVADGLAKLDVTVCVTRSALTVRDQSLGRKIHEFSVFPLSRYLRAFDVAVSAAGYNSYHELLRFTVPTLFIPNLDTALDDQQTRAAFASERGWAHSIEVPTREAVFEAMADLLARGHQMAAGVAQADPGNGARPAIDAVAELIKARGVAA
ncbi:MAG: glycosyltransferase, partial [bacterium]